MFARAKSSYEGNEEALMGVQAWSFGKELAAYSVWKKRLARFERQHSLLSLMCFWQAITALQMCLIFFHVLQECKTAPLFLSSSLLVLQFQHLENVARFKSSYTVLKLWGRSGQLWREKEEEEEAVKFFRTQRLFEPWFWGTFPEIAKSGGFVFVELVRLIWGSKENGNSNSWSAGKTPSTHQLWCASHRGA